MGKEKAAEHKALGNKEFVAKNYEAAIKHFTDAIGEDATDHVFYSNRSACYSSTNKYKEALADGKKCVEIKPDWAKGYSRKGLAEYHLGMLSQADETYSAGLKLAPEDAILKEGHAMVKNAQQSGGAGSSNPMAGLDTAKLMTAMQRNPKIASYLQDQALMAKFQMLMQAKDNPALMQTMSSGLMEDPRLLELFMATQGLEMPEQQEEQPFKPEAQKAAKQPKVEEPPKDERTDAQKEADAFKEEANKLYKEKKFDEAIEKYDKAIAAEPNDIIYYNNKCAVLLEQEKFDECEKLCQELLLKRYEMNSSLPGGASYEKVAKVLNRLASCYQKQKRFDDSIETYKRSLAEDNNRHTRNALREVENAKHKYEKDRMYDPALAEEMKEKGNAHFKASEYSDAKKCYDEAILRNPKDAKLYSNRAGALSKLFAYPDSLRDLEECVKLDPKFVKAYSRMGFAHFQMKDFNKALKAYEDGLKIEPTDEGCLNGRNEVMAKIQRQSGAEPDQEQIAQAMNDPEIQNILKDPNINIILRQLQEDPKKANEAIQKDQKVADAIQKLVLAGIIRLG